MVPYAKYGHVNARKTSLDVHESVDIASGSPRQPCIIVGWKDSAHILRVALNLRSRSFEKVERLLLSRSELK